MSMMFRRLAVGLTLIYLFVGATWLPLFQQSTATYQGPGDIVSGAVAFYSVRAYSRATAGGLAYQLTNNNTSTTQNISTLSNGLPDTVTPATFCSGLTTNCRITKWYDQTQSGACGGSCDVAQSVSNALVWTANVLNGYPCGYNSGTGGFAFSGYGSVGNITVAQPFTTTTVGERTGNFTSVGRTFSAGNIASTFALGWRAATNTYGTQGSTITVTATDGTSGSDLSHFHAFVSVINTNGSTSTVAADNTVSTGNIGAITGVADPMSIWNDVPNDSSADTPYGYMCEVGYWPATAFTTGQIGTTTTGMIGNMHSSTNGFNF